MKKKRREKVEISGKNFTHIRCYPEYRYSSRLIPLLVNRILKEGKKTVAQRVVYNAMQRIKEKHFPYPNWVLQKAVRNLMPKSGIAKSAFRAALGSGSGNKRSLPSEEVTPLECVRIALLWLTDAAKSKGRQTFGEIEKKKKPDYRTHKSFYIKLADQIIAASLGKGLAIKKKRAFRKKLESLKFYRHKTHNNGKYL
jgi:small subunit ribosomal protein S7